jgi:hypothetical protein
MPNGLNELFLIFLAGGLFPIGGAFAYSLVASNLSSLQYKSNFVNSLLIQGAVWVAAAFLILVICSVAKFIKQPSSKNPAGKPSGKQKESIDASTYFLLLRDSGGSEVLFGVT